MTSAGGSARPAPLHATPEGRGLLRAEVRRHVALAGTRRDLAPVLHVGTPPFPLTSVALATPGRHPPGHDPAWDAALARDLVTRLLEGVEETSAYPDTAWLTRSGRLAVTDLELLWLAATADGFSRHGLAVPELYLVTRYGWLDVRSGEHRAWARLRGALPPAG